MDTFTISSYIAEIKYVKVSKCLHSGVYLVLYYDTHRVPPDYYLGLLSTICLIKIIH